MSTQNINTYWTMDGRVYTKHQYLLDDGWPCLHKTSIPTGRWIVVSTQNINTYWMMDGRIYTTSIPTEQWMAMSTQNINAYWTMDGHFYTKHQYLLDDG
jgi:hypothetical protein